MRGRLAAVRDSARGAAFVLYLLYRVATGRD